MIDSFKENATSWDFLNRMVSTKTTFSIWLQATVSGQFLLQDVYMIHLYHFFLISVSSIPNQTHFMPLFFFYTLWKHQKTSGFFYFYKEYRIRPVVWNELRSFFLKYFWHSYVWLSWFLWKVRSKKVADGKKLQENTSSRVSFLIKLQA